MKRASFYIKLGISALFLVLVYLLVTRTQSEASFMARIRQVQPLFVALSILVSCGMVLVSCIKWNILLRHQGDRLPFGYLMKQYLIGYFFSNILPSNMGGDVVRSYYVGKRIESQERSAVAVFLERFTGMIVLLLLAFFGPMFMPAMYSEWIVWASTGFAAILLLGVSIVIGLKEPAAFGRRIADLLFGKIPPLRKLCEKIILAVESFHKKLRSATGSLGAKRGLLTRVMGITLIFYALTLLNVYCSFRAFNYIPPWNAVIAITGIAMLVGTIPLAPFGNFGLTELTYVGFFTIAGVPPDASGAMALLLRLKLFLIFGMLGMVLYLMQRDQEGRPEIMKPRAETREAS